MPKAAFQHKLTHVARTIHGGKTSKRANLMADLCTHGPPWPSRNRAQRKRLNNVSLHQFFGFIDISNSPARILNRTGLRSLGAAQNKIKPQVMEGCLNKHVAHRRVLLCTSPLQNHAPCPQPICFRNGIANPACQFIAMQMRLGYWRRRWACGRTFSTLDFHGNVLNQQDRQFSLKALSVPKLCNADFFIDSAF